LRTFYFLYENNFFFRYWFQLYIKNIPFFCGYYHYYLSIFIECTSTILKKKKKLELKSNFYFEVLPLLVISRIVLSEFPIYFFNEGKSCWVLSDHRNTSFFPKIKKLLPVVSKLLKSFWSADILTICYFFTTINKSVVAICVSHFDVIEDLLTFSLDTVIGM